jgi:4,5-dihydroxyphthalate decarboxylase
MGALTLSVALSSNANTRPILDGRVGVEGVGLQASGIHPSEMFWRQLHFGDFDVSEMSLSSLFIASSLGRTEWVALPIFTSRRFFHTGIVVRRDSGIETPKDLIGRRVGVPEYQQTAAVWVRAALQHEFGVSPQNLHWFMERPLSRSHGGLTEFRAPEGVRLSFIDERTSLGQMLADGSLEAAAWYTAGTNLIDRTQRPAASLAEVRPIFADPVAEGVRYFRKTGILPVNHCVVVRRGLLESHPWLSLNLYSAFSQAKQLALDAVRTGLDPWAQIGDIDPGDVARARSHDPLPYGIINQRNVLDALSGHLVEQGLIPRPIRLEDVFDSHSFEV